MNKFSLKFQDQQTETEYQNFLANSERKLTFILVSIAFAFNYGLRVLLCFIDDDYTLFYFKIGLFIFVVVQFTIVRTKPIYIRHAFVLINLSNLIINFQTDSNTTLAIQNLKGANSMATGFLVLLSGEFPEAVFIFTIQTIYRILTVFIFGDTLNIVTILTSIILNFYCFIYFYSYHKARRSQYLLTRVKSDWDKILTDLINQPYILLKFNYEELNYQVIKQNRFPFYLDDQFLNTDITTFLNNSWHKKLSLSSIIFQQIKLYQQNPQDFFKKEIKVIYNKQLVQMNISIFYSSDPLILLQFEVKQTNRAKDFSQFNFIKLHSLNNIFINLLKALNKKYKQQSLRIIQRKLVRVKLFHTLTNYQDNLKKLNIKKTLKVMKYFFPELKIIFSNNSGQIIETIKNTFLLLLFQIFENSKDKMVNCKIMVILETVQLKFEGNFDHKKLIKFIFQIHYQINQILENYEIQSNSIYQTYIRNIYKYQKGSIIIILPHQSLIELFYKSCCRLDRVYN